MKFYLILFTCILLLSIACTELPSEGCVPDSYCSLNEQLLENCPDCLVAVSAPESESEQGTMKILVIDELERPIRNAEVTLYDDALVEIEVLQTNAQGEVLFANKPFKLGDDVEIRYKELNLSVPRINNLDSRTYYADVWAFGYKPQVVGIDFAEGKAVQKTISLQSENNKLGTSGYFVAAQAPTDAPSYEENGVELMLDAQNLPDYTQCVIRVMRVSALPIPEDKTPFKLSVFMRMTKHCVGVYSVSTTLDPEKPVQVTAAKNIFFSLGPFEKSYGNAAGGLECPVLNIVEQGGNDFSVSVGFRLPILACDNPAKCPYGGSGVSACKRYFNGDCAASSRNQLCGFENICDPVKMGAPAGGGKALIKEQISQDVGKKCCFCGYDAAGRDFNSRPKACEAFFSRSVEPFQKDAPCDVKEIIPIREWDTQFAELSEKYVCQNPIDVYFASHGVPDSDGKDFLPNVPPERNNETFHDFDLNCKNMAEATKICVTSFPSNSIKFGSASCDIFVSEQEIDKYLSTLQTYLGEDQSIEFAGNILTGWQDPNKENTCTLKRVVRVSRQCFSIKPGACKDPGSACYSTIRGSMGIAYPCLDKSGKQTTQRCCPGKYIEGTFSQLGGKCPAQ